MLLMHANAREDIDEAFAGDIVAIAGLKETTTGDTLCDPQHPIILERMEFPDPVIELSVEPKTKADQEKMGIALNRLAAEDPDRKSTRMHSSHYCAYRTPYYACKKKKKKNKNTHIHSTPTSI